MLGRTDSIAVWAIIGISVVAVVTDLLRNRIYNWLTFPALLTGLVFAGVHGGWHGVTDGLLGVLAGFALYGWMFWLRVMGAGDVKLLMALGAWGGFHYCVQTALLGILVGGAMAFVILLATGKAPAFLRRMYRFLLSVFVKELDVEMPKIDRSLKMPFGVSLAAAAIWMALANPFETLGLNL